jgi:hypothetical protein
MVPMVSQYAWMLKDKLKHVMLIAALLDILLFHVIFIDIDELVLKKDS